MKPFVPSWGLSAHSRMTRTTGIAVFFCLPFALWAQGGDKELRAKADALFAQGEYAAAFQPYQTLVGNNQQDFDLNFRYGVCALHSGADKDEAIKYLKRSTLGPTPNPLAWYFLGKAHHLSYQFKEALTAYERYRGTADKKLLNERPVDALELQCRNGQNLLSNLKEIDVHNKVEVAGADFFRFYDLSSIGGKIVVTPDELKTSADKKSKDLSLVYLPDKGGAIYFASYGKGGDTGRDIYRTELLPTGEFATPVKLAGYINTAQDEDFPFMAPDGKSFYFCSKGHNSMGGYDVFKSTYDKGMDVFGAPVNMDFAVNTPDDDLLYLTDPEGKEACFASGRDSKQGTVHVYRVSTAQAVVNITVLKGTFASQFDATDRKAHITVQDALTQETVADVATDMNGNYVLSLPRSGKYRFLVQAGPSGKTHAGVVDVPRSEEPRAYRQEMSLVDQGGEKLMIRNYFDQPLEEDMIALALDEIKRRAKLDVATHAPVAEEKPVEQPKTDPLTRAGFAGDVSRSSAQRMADEDAASLTKTAEDLEHQSVAAFSIALENANLADQHTTRAEELVARANTETDEKRKNDLMVEAARERQSARAASQRATAALRAGEGLADERMATQVRAQKATKLSTDLMRVMAGTDENAMVIKLVELHTRMDEKNAPDGSISPAEKMRRMATESEKEAATALQRANTARGEENELVDRIARKKREEDEAKGGKKETIARERGELEAQLKAMREENERAFAKAQVAERETINARGQAALAKHLATAATGMTVNELNEEQRAQLTQRISGMGSRIAAIALDERFDAAIAMESRELERRTFDWGAPLEGGGSEAIASTRTQQRDASADAQHANPTGTMVQQADIAQGQVRQGGTVDAPAPLATSVQETTGQEGTANTGVPTGSGSDSATSSNVSGQQADGIAQQHDATSDGQQEQKTGVGVAPGQSGVNGSEQPLASGTGATPNGQTTIGDSTARSAGVAQNAERNGSAAGTQVTGQDRTAEVPGNSDAATRARGDEPVGVSRTDTDLASMRGAVTTPVENDPALTGADRPNTSGTEEGAISDTGKEQQNAEELAFVQANELAELKQLRTAEKHKPRRDSLDTRIAELERAMRETADVMGSSTSIATQEPKGQQDLAATGTSTPTTGQPSTEAQGSNAAPPTSGAATGNEQGSANGLQASPGTDNRSSETVRPGTEATTASGERTVEAGTEQSVSPAQATEEAATAERVGAVRPAMEFDGMTSDAKLLDGIYPDYGTSKARITAETSDAKERSAALHGLELMLADSIDAENVRQLDYLESHPDASPTVLKRVDRLRELKEEHVREAERVLAASEQEYAAGESRTMEDAALAQNAPAQGRNGRSIAASTTPHNDDYVDIADDPEQVYTSTMDHHTTKATEAIRERDRDVEKLAGMEDSIDSLEQVLESMPMGKEQTRLRDKTDKLIDDHMILRTEIGLRMGFITKKEFEAAQDSSKRLAAMNTKLGLATNEPQLLLASSLEESAKRDMEQAARLRKQADRTEDIVLRDSLLRTAYAQELTALREMDRSHTVRNHIQSEGYVRGEQLTYEEVERKMFHAEEEVPVADNAATGQPNNTVAEADRASTLTTAETRTDNTLAVGDRYKTFMSGDSASPALSGLAVADASTLRSEAQRAAERSSELEQASIAAADRANAYQDSAATAKRSDRDRLEREASLARAASDSLHAASLLASDQSQEFEHQAVAAQDASAFQQRLLKYYYLNDQEQALVMNEEDRSRYFQARAKALEQRGQAVRDQEQCASTKQLADTLLQQSKEILANPNPGGAALTPAQMDQARVLADKAVLLNHRADSLHRASERLNMAAGVNESQAASILQALTPERGTEIMALEQRTRRVEPLLAQARSLQSTGGQQQGATGTGAADQPAGSTQDIAATTAAPAGSASGTNPVSGIADTNGAPAPGGTTASVPAPVVASTTEAPAERSDVAAVPVVERASAPTPDAGAPRLLAPLTADVFEMGTVAAPRNGPILIDQPMPAGVVYKVQIGAFKQDIPDALFSDLSPVSGETVGNGLTRYAVGMFTSAESAVKATRTVRERGYRDAFVVAYQDGRRVSLTQAMRAARPVAAEIAATADLPASQPVRIAAPSTLSVITPSDSALAAEQAVLAKYPASAEQVLAQFAPPADAAAYYSDPKAAPARQVETVKGLFFTVQVGVYSKPTALDKLFNITPLNSERTENLKIRYTTGVFTDMEKARGRKDQTVGLGVKDAFITAYLNGKRIPMRDAKALINKFGAGVFADPSLITR